jgi:predicted TIM-barrel fold metal-dependent hydrolase
MVPARTLAELDAWHAMRVEEVIEPDRPIVDPHHHLWRRPPYVYELPELNADLDSGHDVRATLFVQNNARYRTEGPEALRPVGETDYVRAMAAADGRACAGIVGYADLRRGAAVRAVLEAHVEAGRGRFRGIRQQAQYHPVIGSLAKLSPPEGLLGDPAFREGFAELAPLGLSFDAWLYFTQLGELTDLAGAFLDTPIILNHIGAPLGIGPYEGKREEVFAAWAAGIRALARHPNVAVKLGGLGMPLMGFGFETRAVPAGSDELAAAWRPYVETCIAALGPDRCMFESNFPVDKQSCSYRTLWNAFKRLASGASDAEKDALFQGTARRVYDLGSDPFEN